MLESNATGDADAYHLARLLADDLVWRLFPLLATSDVQLGEVQARLGAPREDLEERLTRLAQLGIIDQRVSDVDAGTAYFQAGVKKVIVAAPVKGDALNIVMGVNDHLYDPERHHLVTAASCTTNCLAPVVKVI
jgi:DNA-binding Lrp family transcriptional regulator